ncbi:MAG: response regulator transcription factor [Proteobacteria bacterium]|nr:response regulator transcription factor [Pseudomonadota bacterium]MBI3495736.1 response regulator transcription factor [Pseudomonadota bacterium]
MRILVVEDDPELGPHIAEVLRQQGYAVDLSPDGEEGHFLGDTESYDAVLLDLGLPSRDGISVLKHWRAEQRQMPVIILTARGRWSEKVAGFDAGADDYVTKPFQMEEVLARLRAVIRRSAGHAKAELVCGPLTLDTRAHRVTVGGVPVRLSGQEYKILSYLMHHQGKAVSRTELAEHIYDHTYDKDSNLIEVFIGRLRKKLGVDVIITVRGLGYMVMPPSPDLP